MMMRFELAGPLIGFANEGCFQADAKEFGGTFKGSVLRNPEPKVKVMLTIRLACATR